MEFFMLISFFLVALFKGIFCQEDQAKEQ